MKLILLAMIFVVGSFVFGQGIESQKLVSGSGLYWCEDASTRGKGNIIGSMYGRGFKWDDGAFRIFPNIGGEYGILPWLDVAVSSELLTYNWVAPGDFRLRLKAALPLENRLRLFNGGLYTQFAYNRNDTFPSNGWRNQGDLGFSPEGLRYVGGFIDIMLLGDAELIAWKSFLPIKYYLNFGFRIPVSTDLDGYYQALLFTGVCYKGLITDFFLEYSLEALQGFKGYRIIDFKQDGIAHSFRFPYYFSENPMYLTPGFRMKYASGASITISLPILLSTEQGYTSSSVKRGEITNDVKLREGITDGFSPFYADWKLTARLDFPFRYNPVNAEIVRKFILMKSRKANTTIDIDEKIKGENSLPETEEEKLQKEIEQKRQEMLKNNMLD